MSGSSKENSTIRPVRLEEQGDALRLLLASLDPIQQVAEAERLCRLAALGQVSLEGLLMAERNGKLTGVTWAQQQPGRTAVIWIPQLISGETEATAYALVQAADQMLQAGGVCLGQVLFDNRTVRETAWFTAIGFQHLVELDYLVCQVLGDGAPEAPSADASSDPCELEFEPFSDANRVRFSETLERTYLDTLDCPSLNGVRDPEDVLAGYQATGTFDPSRWLLVRYQGRDAGCLLLTDHTPADQWELIYMGLVPEARGHGLGRQVTEHAQTLTREAAVQRLVLAVDAENGPAQAMYATQGFVRWEQKSVFLRIYQRQATP